MQATSDGQTYCNLVVAAVYAILRFLVVFFQKHCDNLGSLSVGSQNGSIGEHELHDLEIKSIQTPIKIKGYLINKGDASQVIETHELLNEIRSLIQFGISVKLIFDSSETADLVVEGKNIDVKWIIETGLQKPCRGDVLQSISG